MNRINTQGNTTRLATAAAAVVSALVLVACGGGTASTAATTATTPAIPTLASDRLVVQQYGGFELLYDCSQHTALRYEYVLNADTGVLPRPANFTLDPTLPAGCAQQGSTGTYASVRAGWDRGHLVSSNHMDYNAAYLLRANYMSNVVPQVSTFNQGIWLDAENVAECWRDIAPVRVVGGVVYDDPSNDAYFMVSHGIATPDWFWKVVITTDPATRATKAIAWRIPNRNNLAPLDSYLVSIDELEQWLGSAMIGIDDSTVPAGVKAVKPATTWPQPAGCSLSAAPNSPS
jgi:endonuclease G